MAARLYLPRPSWLWDIHCGTRRLRTAYSNVSQAEDHHWDRVKAGTAPSDAEMLLLDDDRPMRPCGMTGRPRWRMQNCN